MTSTPVLSFGVIFDMDGVLVDSNALHLQAFQALGAQLRVPFSEELLKRTVGMHNNQILPLWLGERAGPLSAARIQTLAEEKEELYRAMAATQLQPIPGVLDFVARLEAAGVPLAVGSSGPRENVELALTRLGLKGRMKSVITGSDISHANPTRSLFEGRGGTGHPDPPLRGHRAPQWGTAPGGGLPGVGITTSRSVKRWWKRGARSSSCHEIEGLIPSCRAEEDPQCASWITTGVYILNDKWRFVGQMVYKGLWCAMPSIHADTLFSSSEASVPRFSLQKRSFEMKTPEVDH